MRIPTKTISSWTACFLITLYLIISFYIFLKTSAGSLVSVYESYETLFFIIINVPFYLLMWIFLMMVCASSRVVRYKPILLGLIFIIQTIGVMVNSGPITNLGSMSGRVNFIQMILTKPPYSGVPWFEYQVFMFFMALYDFLILVLLFDLLLSRSPRNEKY